MNARLVHSILAAGVQSPNLIVEWQENPQFLLDQGIEPRAMDLTAMWKFAGLAVKVRHNGMRRDFPCTFRLMSVTGLEVEVFATYATYCATRGLRFGATAEQRAVDLISFLGQWLDLEATDQALLWDMIRHEQAIAELTRLASASSLPTTPDDPSLQRAELLPSSVPRVRGEMILHELQSDPRLLKTMLFRSPSQLGETALQTHYFSYWLRAPSADVMILDLDAFAFYTLSLVDGSRSVSELGSALGATGPLAATFANLLMRLTEVGILDFSPASEIVGT
jgi:hypothetical protein